MVLNAYPCYQGLRLPFISVILNTGDFMLRLIFSWLQGATQATTLHSHIRGRGREGCYPHFLLSKTPSQEFLSKCTLILKYIALLRKLPLVKINDSQDCSTDASLRSENPVKMEFCLPEGQGRG